MIVVPCAAVMAAAVILGAAAFVYALADALRLRRELAREDRR